LNKKMFALVIIFVSVFLISPIVNAEPAVLTIWTDRTKYGPGEKGTLYIAYFNDLSAAVEIKNITLTYVSWNAYINNAWVGNETRKLTGVSLVSNDKRVFSDITFTVPSDGRAVTTRVDVEIWTDHGLKSAYTYISVPDTPRSLEQIVTLLTVLVVLVIVCSIIIAAAVFLSARRPQVTWSKEEKT
jgi:hypothetical protein